MKLSRKRIVGSSFSTLESDMRLKVGPASYCSVSPTRGYRGTSQPSQPLIDRVI